ncbi:MAG TPA: hypothetical protein DCM86_12700 [Verrucomicrobiales bacterium]|nr:hypothetical protein [Verrucomicrobiales bacterium]
MNTQLPNPFAAPEINRRDFLRHSSTATVVATMAGVRWPGLAPGPRRLLRRGKRRRWCP